MFLGLEFLETSFQKSKSWILQLKLQALKILTIE